MKTPKTLTIALTIATLSVLGVADADAQYREDSGYHGNRGRPTTVLDLMKQRRAVESPTVRNPPGAAPIRRPPGFVTDSSTAGTRRAIVSPGTEEPMLPGTQTRDTQMKDAEPAAPGVAAESAPQFPKPKEPAVEGEAPPEGAPVQAPAEGEAAPAEASQSTQPAPR